jgi:hypothetical protein
VGQNAGSRPTLHLGKADDIVEETGESTRCTAGVRDPASKERFLEIRCRGPGLRRARSSGMEMKRGRQLRRPLSYAWRNARNISPSFGGSPCGGTGPFAHQGAISTHRKAPLKWEKDQPSRDNDPPLFVVFDVDAFFSKLVFQVRSRHDPIPIAPFATTANHLVAPRLYRATIINQHGGADQEEPRIFLIMARAPQEREVPHLIFLTRRIAHSFRQHRVKLALGEFLGLRRYWLARRHHPIHRAVTCSQLRWSSLRHRHQGLLKSLV